MGFERFGPAIMVRGPTAASTGRIAARAVTAPILVEVGREAIRADVVRNGVALPDLVIDASIISSILRPIAIQTKVVTQSVEAGRAVPRGTVVDLTVAEPGRLPIKVFSGVHKALADSAVDDVFSTFIDPNPAIRGILTRVNDPAALTTGDREALRTVLAANNVDLADAPDQDEAAAFTALLAANLLHG